ncbi:hypothetical protein KY346_06600 [Candidatus Woesearchaeota archaeon]|nr:hypothetical protein [Candidatus Woesearchaeota archaeon]
MKKIVLFAILLTLSLVLLSCEFRPLGKAPYLPAADLAGFPKNIVDPGYFLGVPSTVPVDVLAGSAYTSIANNLIAGMEQDMCVGGPPCLYNLTPNFISQPSNRFVAVGTCDDAYMSNLLDPSTCQALVPGKAVIQYVGDYKIAVAGATLADVSEAVNILLAHNEWQLNGYYSDILNTETILAASHKDVDGNIEYIEKFYFKPGKNKITNPLILPVDKQLITSFFSVIMDKINSVYHYNPLLAEEYEVFNAVPADSPAPGNLNHFGVAGETYIVDAKEAAIVTITGVTASLAIQASAVYTGNGDEASISTGGSVIDTNLVAQAFITGSAVAPITGAAFAGQTNTMIACDEQTGEGDNPYVYGEVRYTGITRRADTCVDQDTLTEYYCVDGEIYETEYKAYPGTKCVGGAFDVQPLLRCYRTAWGMRDDRAIVGMSCPDGWVLEYVLGLIYKNSAPGRSPLYACYRETDATRPGHSEHHYLDHFVSTDSNCEDKKGEGQPLLGYVSSSEIPGITYPIHRCWPQDDIGSSIWNHFVTNTACTDEYDWASEMHEEGTWHIIAPCIGPEKGEMDPYTKQSVDAVGDDGALHTGLENYCDPNQPGHLIMYGCDSGAAANYVMKEELCKGENDYLMGCEDGACLRPPAGIGEACTFEGGCRDAGYECIEGICTRKIPIYMGADQSITKTQTAQLVGYVLDQGVDNVPNTQLVITCEQQVDEEWEYEGTATTCRSGTIPRETLGYLFYNYQPTGTVKFPFPLLSAHNYYFYPESYCGDGIVDPGEECDIAKANPTQDCDQSEYDSWFGDCTDTSCDLCECKGVLDCNACVMGSADYCSYCTHCGDGVVNCGEQCEPPNTATCDAACMDIVVTPPGVPPLVPPPSPPATPPLPHQFYGWVFNATPGMPVLAVMQGVNFPTIVDANILYGYNPLFLITGTTNGTNIAFYVNNSFDQNYPFQQGGLTRLDLTFTPGAPGPVCGNGMVEAGEQCDPPDGITCGPNCQWLHNCSDNIINFGETDIDCGGPICPPCANGQMCVRNRDCISNYCSNGICKKRPTPSVGGGGGGGRGRPAEEFYGTPLPSETISEAECFDDWICDPWGPCIAGLQERMCFLNDYPECTLVLEKPITNQTCELPPVPEAVPTCFDGIQNQDETFPDCGGSICKPCDPGLPCILGRDCVTGFCDPVVEMCSWPPVEEVPKPASNWWIWLILGLIIVGGGGAIIYLLAAKKKAHPDHRVKDLREYVEKFKKKGVSEAKIRRKVLSHGWKKADWEKVKGI